MMRLIEKAIGRTLGALGFELRRLTGRSVLFDNFANLATAYERCLNDRENLIPPNDLRPRLLGRLMGTPPSEAYFIVQALSKCRDVPGDVCEFGVAQGETSALIANEIASSGSKRLHLFDSFKGLPEPSEKDQLKDDVSALGSIEAYAGTMSCPEDMVHSRLAAVSFPVERYVIHKGFIEQVVPDGTEFPGGVCFAYVDFDFYEPIRIALDFLDQVTPKGAIIIVDDYDFLSTGVKTAVDEFVQAKNSSRLVYECHIPDSCYGHFAVLSKRG